MPELTKDHTDYVNALRYRITEKDKIITELKAQLSEFTTSMICGHPRVALDVVEKRCSVCWTTQHITDLEDMIAAARSELRMKYSDSRTLAEACHDQWQATLVAIDEGKQKEKETTKNA